MFESVWIYLQIFSDRDKFLHHLKGNEIYFIINIKKKLIKVKNDYKKNYL